MKENKKALSLFHPTIQRWFSENVGYPTDVQEQAWPEIASGRHVLATAPTGSGKTLTAFLWAINQLVTNAWPTGQLRALYISPLKALNNDVQRNLLNPLAELREYFIADGVDLPAINVFTRSGDTSAEERRRMQRHAPEILITTPESLNILLSSKNSRLMLNGIATVILDEIHALAGNKRGVHLITAIERLTLLSCEFQRIALSATVKPLQGIAEFIGGYRRTGNAPDYHYEKRNVSIVQSKTSKQYNIAVSFPENARENLVDGSWWPVLIEEFKKIINSNQSTLLFANSRRVTEKVTRLINEIEPGKLAYSHHGSLSREIRMVVEQRLKNGELRAIVATNSLELGIDIGKLDQVVLIQSPHSISSAIQRVGRSGHGVGQVSSGVLYPTHGRDFLDAAVIARTIMDQDIEDIRPARGCLDVLAQVILSMTLVEQWDIDELYTFIKTCYPYSELSRKQYDLVLDMLAGRYADTRLRELKPRISIDRLDNKVYAKEGMHYILFISGGTIPDRGLFDLRLQDSRAKIGELDEEFVWERSVGDTFTLGVQVWRIQNITHNDVEVVPIDAKPGIFPFWKADEQNRDFHYAEKVSTFLGHANANLNSKSFMQELSDTYFMDETAKTELIDYLQRQKKSTKSDLPHRRHLLIEHFDDPMNKTDRKQVILHTLWGGRVNHPFSLALAAAWEKKYKYRLEIFVNNDCVLLMLPHEITPKDIFDLITPENIEPLLRQKLEETGFFGARFRENAGRALLLPKASFKKRLPLWLNRLRSKKLMDAIMQYSDFPILLETWRTCLQDEFDLENLKCVLEEIHRGEIKVTETTTTSASPFADSLIWRQTDKYMYEDDTPSYGKKSSLSQDLLKEVAFSSHIRPRIPDELIQRLEEKLKRTAPGYAPASPQDLLDWTKDRLLISQEEWLNLLEAIKRDNDIYPEDILPSISDKMVCLELTGAASPLVCAVEILPRIARSFHLLKDDLSPQSVFPHGEPLTQSIISSIDKIFQDNDLSEEPADEALVSFMQQWLSYYGPLESDRIKNMLGFSDDLLSDLIETLSGTESIIADQLREESESLEICDAENLEILLRMLRRTRQPSFKALSLPHLSLFLATYQGILNTDSGIEGLQKSMDQLFGYPSNIAAWEEFILPARLNPYYPSWLDSLMQSSDLIWYGCGNKKIAYVFPEDLELYRPAKLEWKDGSSKTEPAETSTIIPDDRGKYSFFDITEHSGLDSTEAAEKLWNLAWKGNVTNDTYDVIRKGILNKFAAIQTQDKKASSRRSGFNRWTSSRPITGHWYRLDYEDDERDALENEELNKDRVRQLFRRYGILFRELLDRESPILKWSNIFKTLRLMELSGEILSGYFFEGIPGLQFISHEAFRFLNNDLGENAVYWMNATDPASLSGVKIEGLKALLPSRIASTWIVFRGTNPMLIAKRNGKALEFNVPPDDIHLQEYLSFFKVLLTREFNPLKAVVVEAINGEPAAKSVYAQALKEFGFTGSYRELRLVKRY